jgi:hypothetical protein
MPEEFGKAIRLIFELPRPKTRYAIVPRAFTDWTIPSILPDRTLDNLIGRFLGLVKM